MKAPYNFPDRYPMNTRILSAICMVFTAASVSFAEAPSATPSNASSDAGWISLFDGKSFRGWYPKIQNQKKNEDPARYFQVDDGVIHVYKDQPAGVTVPNGYLATNDDYAYFHLRMEYKWGTKKFKPRMNQVRDAGLLYHVTQPDEVWPRCIECQIQENDVGDCFTVRGVQVGTTVEMADIQTPMGIKSLPRYKPLSEGGLPKRLGDSGIVRIVKSHTVEHDGWNKLEIIVRGREGSEHIVNGQTVFKATDLMELGTRTLSAPLKPGEVDKRKWLPLTHGRIALQCEYAEVFYRNIEIHSIPDGPLLAKDVK